jgi:hypothetical protein
LYIIDIMPSVATIAAFAGLASLALASPVAPQNKRAAGFRVNQISTGTVKRNGPAAMKRALQKYGKTVPSRVIAAAAAEGSGTVAATPEQYDSEYLCPVDVGGTTLNLDFDTGSADL